MDEILEILSPKEILSSKIISLFNNENSKLETAKFRKDFRKLDELRELTESPNVISNRENSCCIKRGNTNIISTLTFEISEIKASQTVSNTGGYFIPNIELYSNASPLQLPGKTPLKSIQNLNLVLASILNDIPELLPKNCLAIRDLEGHIINSYCQVMYLDVLLLCDDGSLLDTILYSITYLLTKQIKIREIIYDQTNNQLYETDFSYFLKVNKNLCPVSLSFSIFSPKVEENNTNVENEKSEIKYPNILFIDPSLNEEILADNNIYTIVGTLSGDFLRIEQLGSGLSSTMQLNALEISKTYFKQLKENFL